MINYLTVENTSCCGANCVMCPREKYKYQFNNMSEEVFRTLVSNIEKLNIKQIDIGGYGDPLVDPYFCERVEYLKGHFPNIKLSTITTGQLLRGKIADCIAQNIDNLKISNYGAKKETYERVHRGSLDYSEIKKNIDAFLKREKRPETIIAFLILDENKEDLDEWLSANKERAEGVQVWYPHNFAGYKPEYNNFSTLDNIKTCGRIGNDFYIHENGDVSVCCFDFNHDLVVGNIMMEKLSDIEKSAFYQEILEKHSANNFNGLICKGCDQIRDRSKCLYYSSDSEFHVGEKSQRIK